jgi:hypothetical protein
MIIHSPIISGSLTFADGSTFTLPDGGNYSGSFSGSVQISEVLSHLVPNANEVYDLGSSTNRFRDLYLSNNSIVFPSGSLGFGNNGFGFSDPSGAPAPIVTSEVKVLDESDGSFAKLSVVGGTLTTTAFDPFGVESAFDMKSQLSGSFTGSFLGEMVATNGVVSGSSQVVIGSVDGFTAHSASVDGRILTEKGRVDAILATADADKDSFAEIVTLINSVDTTNDNAFASFYTASNDRFDNIEGFTSSIDTTIKTKMDADSVVSGSSQLVSLLPSGVVSSSAQVDADSITNFDSNVKTKLDVDGVISSSVQVDVLQTTNFNDFSASVATTFGGLSTDYNDLQNIPSGIISSSEQLAADFLDTLGDNVVSSSAQIDLTQTTNYASGIKLKLDAENVFSGSSQVSFSSIVDKPTLVSGSSQVTITSTTDFSTFSGSLKTTDDALATVDAAQTVRLDQLATASGSYDSHIASTANPHSVTADQVGLGNVTNESKATMFSSPTFTGTVSGVTATHVGLGNVDNTSDANKPVSTAGQTALDLKANLASPTFTGTVSGVSKAMVGLGNVTNESKATMFTNAALTGTPTAPTPADNNNSTQIATTAFVMQEVSDLIGGAGAAFDTLLEISASLASGDSTLNTLVDGKLSKSSNLSDLTDTSAARTNLGVAIGTNVQAYNSTLAAVAGGTYTGDDSITTVGTIGTGTWAATDVALAHGGTGASDAAGARTNLGLVIGTNVQAYNSTLAAVAGGTYSGDDSITTVGTIGTGTWNGSVIASAYLDADTAHLSGTQTFTGAKTFSDSTASTTKTTGAVIVTGGVGIGGALNVGGDVVAYASSDRRLKDNVTNIEFALEKVCKLNGVTWDWNDNADELQKTLPNVGVIAQEVEAVLPQLIQHRDTGYMAVDYAKLTGLLIEAVKEQQKQIDELKSRLG